MKHEILQFPMVKPNSVFGDLRGWHIAIHTTDYHQLIQWYREKLDFRLIHEMIIGDLYLALIGPAGDNDFIIEVLWDKGTTYVDHTDPKKGYDHICFHVVDLDKTLEALIQRDIAIIRCFEVSAIGKRVAFIADPFGNKIEFVGELKTL